MVKVHLYVRSLMVRAFEGGALKLGCSDEYGSSPFVFRSPDGRFASTQCKGQPCLVRLHDGAKLLVRTGLPATEVAAFFNSEPVTGRITVDEPRPPSH
jgi:hypothetical protein